MGWRRRRPRRLRPHSGGRRGTAARCGDGRSRHRVLVGERAHDPHRSAAGGIGQRAAGRGLGGGTIQGAWLRERAHRELSDHRMGARHRERAAHRSEHATAGRRRARWVAPDTGRGARGRRRHLSDPQGSESGGPGIAQWQDRHGRAAHGAYPGRRGLYRRGTGAHRRAERSGTAWRHCLPPALGGHRQPPPGAHRHGTLRGWTRGGARICAVGAGCRPDRAHRRAWTDGARAAVLPCFVCGGRPFAERHRRGARPRAPAGSGVARRASRQLGPGHWSHRRRRGNRHRHRGREADS